MDGKWIVVGLILLISVVVGCVRDNTWDTDYSESRAVLATELAIQSQTAEWGE